jgi:hypothetical protein
MSFPEGGRLIKINEQPLSSLTFFLIISSKLCYFYHIKEMKNDTSI